MRGCAAQRAEFEAWPFDSISRIVGPDENQGKAFAGQGIAATLAAYDIVEPKLAAFYAALNDEQKARLYRDMAAPAAANAAQTSGRPEAREERREAQEARRDRRERYSSRRERWRAYAAARESAGSPHERSDMRDSRESRISLRSSGLRNASAAAPGFSGTCEEVGAVLRNWPVREIERDVRLSDAQRVALYELVTTSLKAAATLSSACPAEAALTPVGRMETMRKRLSAVRAATAAIRPALARFYEALDQGQKVRFAGMS